jgi:CBS domain-containing protein
MTITTRSAGPTVGELMSIEPVTITEDEPAATAQRLMSERRVSGLPVVSRMGALVGVISQTDFVRAHASGQAFADWPGMAVRHLMTSPALTVRSNEPLLTAARRMETNRVHRLVVIAPDGEHPVGVISTLDLVSELARVLEEPHGR